MALLDLIGLSCITYWNSGLNVVYIVLPVLSVYTSIFAVYYFLKSVLLRYKCRHFNKQLMLFLR